MQLHGLVKTSHFVLFFLRVKSFIYDLSDTNTVFPYQFLHTAPAARRLLEDMLQHKLEYRTQMEELLTNADPMVLTKNSSDDEIAEIVLGTVMFCQVT